MFILLLGKLSAYATQVTKLLLFFRQLKSWLYLLLFLDLTGQRLWSIWFFPEETNHRRNFVEVIPSPDFSEKKLRLAIKWSTKNMQEKWRIYHPDVWPESQCSKFNKDDFAWLFFFLWTITATGKSRKSCVIKVYYDFVFSWVKWDVCVVLSVQSHREFLGLCSNSQVALLVSAEHFPSVALRINIAVSWEKEHMHFYDGQQTPWEYSQFEFTVFAVSTKFCKAGYEICSSFVKEGGCHFCQTSLPVY